MVHGIGARARPVASQRKRLVPSGITPCPWVLRIAVQRLGAATGRTYSCGIPACRADDVIADLQRRHAGPDLAHDAGALVPRIAGNFPSESRPDRV